MPGKTLDGDSHIFISAIIILVFARGCFGPGPCVFRISRQAAGEFGFIMYLLFLVSVFQMLFVCVVADLI